MFFAVAALAIGFGGCASMLVSFNSAWHGAPSAGQMVGAVAFDAVTIPVQLPFWIALGVGSGLDKLDRGIEDRSWQSRRRELHDKFLKDPEKMQDAAPEFHSKGLPLGLVYADEAIPLSEKFLSFQSKDPSGHRRGICRASKLQVPHGGPLLQNDARRDIDKHHCTHGETSAQRR